MVIKAVVIQRDSFLTSYPDEVHHISEENLPETFRHLS